MPRIKVDGNKSNPRPYFPKELIQKGFSGEMEIINDAVTATIIHPEATLKQVKRSLEIILQDVELRIEREEHGKSKTK